VTPDAAFAERLQRFAPGSSRAIERLVGLTCALVAGVSGAAYLRTCAEAMSIRTGVPDVALGATPALAMYVVGVTALRRRTAGSARATVFGLGLGAAVASIAAAVAVDMVGRGHVLLAVPASLAAVVVGIAAAIPLALVWTLVCLPLASFAYDARRERTHDGPDRVAAASALWTALAAVFLGGTFGTLSAALGATAAAVSLYRVVRRAAFVARVRRAATPGLSLAASAEVGDAAAVAPLFAGTEASACIVTVASAAPYRGASSEPVPIARVPATPTTPPSAVLAAAALVASLAAAAMRWPW
jgi:hypothetical protein